MRVHLLATALLIAIPATACSSHTENDRGSARPFPLTDFTSVALLGSDDVDIRVGPAFSVRAVGPVSELDQLRITRDGTTLRVERKPTTGFGWGSHRGVKVFVTMPRIVGAEVRGSGDMAIDRIQGSSFSGSASGSGDFTIGLLGTSQARLANRGSGDIKVAGTVDRLAADVASSGSIEARGLHARNATVSVAGSGDMSATVDGQATVSLSGSGDVDLGGRARCTISKSGSGDVTCGQ